ncbi:MAG TPA: hypothetical protein VM432_09565 [Bdellovibrionales bacterium]|jgi:hypothetical protein|nr:hypothetical protein [Bdellovibrionales bacterium]
MKTSPAKQSSRTLLKIVLSLFIVFHLSAVLILPNSSSLMGRRLSWLFLDYANLMIFNRTWQFFSPGPMPNMYLEYEVETEDNALEDVRETYQWPKSNVNRFNNDFFLRTVAGMRFLGSNEVNFHKYFIPYLCRQHPGAVAVNMRSVVEQIPSIERAGEYEDFLDMQQRFDLPSQRYSCEGPE